MFDFSNAFLTGLISGGVSLAVGLIGFRIFAPRAIRALLASEGVNSFVNAKANEVINGYLTDLHEHPEKYSSTVKPFLESLAKSFGGSEPVEGSSDMGDPLMRFIPRRYRGLYALARMFGFGIPGQKKEGDAISTFGG